MAQAPIAAPVIPPQPQILRIRTSLRLSRYMCCVQESTIEISTFSQLVNMVDGESVATRFLNSSVVLKEGRTVNMVTLFNREKLPMSPKNTSIIKPTTKMTRRPWLQFADFFLISAVSGTVSGSKARISRSVPSLIFSPQRTHLMVRPACEVSIGNRFWQESQTRKYRLVIVPMLVKRIVQRSWIGRDQGLILFGHDRRHNLQRHICYWSHTALWPLLSVT